MYNKNYSIYIIFVPNKKLYNNRQIKMTTIKILYIKKVNYE